MKKAICIAALTAITFSSVFALPFKDKNSIALQDTTKKKEKVKNGKAKMKVKRDTTVDGKTTQVKTKMKKDSVKTPPM